MFATSKDIVYNFQWKELHKKILKIAVAEPNPEVLEFLGQVYGMDEKGTVYLLHEWDCREDDG
jgi:hypothetical protein